MSLGAGAFDPRSFAAAWAFSRGVAERPSPDEPGARRWLVLAAVAALALVAIAGGVLAVVDPSSTSERREALPAVALWDAQSPDGGPIVVFRASAGAPDDLTRIVNLPLPPDLRVSVTAVAADDSGLDTRTLGYVLLAVGLTGAIAVWLGRAISTAGRSARRHATV